MIARHCHRYLHISPNAANALWLMERSKSSTNLKDTSSHLLTVSLLDCPVKSALSANHQQHVRVPSINLCTINLESAHDSWLYEKQYTRLPGQSQYLVEYICIDHVALWASAILPLIIVLLSFITSDAIIIQKISCSRLNNVSLRRLWNLILTPIRKLAGRILNITAVRMYVELIVSQKHLLDLPDLAFAMRTSRNKERCLLQWETVQLNSKCLAVDTDTFRLWKCISASNCYLSNLECLAKVHFMSSFGGTLA